MPAHGVITLLGKYSQIITGSGWVSLGSFLSATLSKLKLEPAPIFKAYPIQNVTANAKAVLSNNNAIPLNEIRPTFLLPGRETTLKIAINTTGAVSNKIPLMKIFLANDTHIFVCSAHFI